MLARHLFSITSPKKPQKSRKRPPKREKSNFQILKYLFQILKKWFLLFLDLFSTFLRFFIKGRPCRRTRAEKSPKKSPKSPKNRPQSRSRHWEGDFDEFIAFQAGFIHHAEIARSVMIFYCGRKSIYSTDNWPHECWDVKRCDIST